MIAAGMNKKVLIMAGGTGGHIFPALCIAEDLMARGVSVEWLGTRQGMEAKVIPQASIPIHFISISGLRGSSLLRKIMAPFVIFVAVMQAVKKLLAIKPNCVLGMGGFASGPGGVAAWMLRKKLVIHEQNAIAGASNQLLFPLAYTVMEAFSGAFARKRELTSNPFIRPLIKSGREVHVGNPVRADILAVPAPEARLQDRSGPLNLLILGGSLGAVSINKLIPQMLSQMSPGERPRVWHQCGSRNVNETFEMYRQQNLELSDDIRVEGFIADVAEAYAWADLVVCRAGALTVAELTNVGLASILIPYPYAVDDHQTENARYLSDADAAFLIQQSDLNVEKLQAIVRRFTDDRQSLMEYAQAARSLAQPRATELASTLCIEACHA